MLIKRIAVCGLFALIPAGAECKDVRVLTVLAGCGDVEILDDLMHSVEGLKAYCEKNRISFSIEKKTRECGYVLRNNRRKKAIRSVMTDVDLLSIVNEFYGLKTAK